MLKLNHISGITTINMGEGENVGIIYSMWILIINYANTNYFIEERFNVKSNKSCKIARTIF